MKYRDWLLAANTINNGDRDISSLSASIAVGITLGTGGYSSPFTVTNSGEIANLSYNPSGPGTMGLYVPGSLAPVSILNNGTIMGGGAMFVAGYGVSLCRRLRRLAVSPVTASRCMARVV